MIQEYVVRVFNDEVSYYGRWKNQDTAIGDIQAAKLWAWICLNVANHHGVELMKVIPGCRQNYDPPPHILMSDYMNYTLRLSANTGWGGDTWLRLGGLKENTDFETLKNDNWFWKVCNDRGELIKTIKKIQGIPCRT